MFLGQKTPIFGHFDDFWGVFLTFSILPFSSSSSAHHDFTTMGTSTSIYTHTPFQTVVHARPSINSTQHTSSRLANSVTRKQRTESTS